jgi:prepilin-type N-terminal cleavage/methylation domain-containing protein
MKRVGFTLIELLVVIAIIAVLMGILMPALRTVRDQAKRVHCVANVRTLSLAWLQYANNNDDLLVGGNVPRSPDFKNATETLWVQPPQDEAGEYTGEHPTLEDEIRGIERGALFSYVKMAEAYRCPADQRKRDPSKADYRSFSIAGGMNGEERWNYTERGLRKYSEIRNPATKYVFVEEGEPRKWNMGSWIIYTTGDSWCDPLATEWHGNRTCLGWADGHTGIQQWQDERTKQMAEYYAGGSWSPTHPGSPDLKFMQIHYALKPESK